MNPFMLGGNASYAVAPSYVEGGGMYQGVGGQVTHASSDARLPVFDNADVHRRGLLQHPFLPVPRVRAPLPLLRGGQHRHAGLPERHLRAARPEPAAPAARLLDAERAEQFQWQ
uniref:Uncharacterized protein n=1 Tax=Steinernema glaseri TaxID=37863 RepID=A0A1I8AMQ6_9BILA